jgi:hypothetical protein
MKTFEYRLRPNAKQEAALTAVLAASRQMYNGTGMTGETARL